MTQQQTGASLNPETFAEGGPPVQKNMTIKTARYEVFTYPSTGQKTFSAQVVLVEDDGTEHAQNYSVGDPTRWTHSQDQKTAIPVVTGTSISKSCNFAVLLTALVNAGFPRESLGSDIGALDGLYAFWDGIPEPAGRGAMREAPKEGEQQRQRVILVPTKILALPGQQPQQQQATQAAPPPPPMATSPAPAPAPAPQPQPPVETPPGAATPPQPVAPAPNGTNTEQAGKIIASFQKLWATNGGVVTLQQLFPAVSTDYPSEGMQLMPLVQGTIEAAGYVVDPATQAITSKG